MLSLLKLTGLEGYTNSFFTSASGLTWDTSGHDAILAECFYYFLQTIHFGLKSCCCCCLPILLNNIPARLAIEMARKYNAYFILCFITITG